MTMASQQGLEKMNLRKSYRNVWHTDLMGTVQADFPYCCFAFCGRCGESRCPEFCLATEVFLCFGNSVASTRFLLQDEFNIQTTQCDNCIITQHKVEMDKRDGKFGPPPMMVPPQFQQMSRIDQPLPPAVGYPPAPPPAYAYQAPPQGHPYAAPALPYGPSGAYPMPGPGAYPPPAPYPAPSYPNYK